MPMSPEKKKFFTFRNWSIFQIRGMLKMLETMNFRAKEIPDTEDIRIDIKNAKKHIFDILSGLVDLNYTGDDNDGKN